MDGYEPAAVAQSSDQISAGKRQVRASQPRSDLVAKSLRESASREKRLFQLMFSGFSPWAQEWHSISQWEHMDKEACSFPDLQETATGEGLSVSPSRAYLLWSNFFHELHQALSLPHDSACWC